MANVLAKLIVEDYDKWKQLFDEYADARRDYGLKGAQVFRNSDNPNELLILYETDDLDRAWDWFERQIPKLLKESGIIQGKPKIFAVKERKISF